jgi:AraC-like DNA-binding protein
MRRGLIYDITLNDIQKAVVGLGYSVADLCEAAKISRPTYYRRRKAPEGLTVREYERLREAQTKLIEQGRKNHADGRDQGG